MSRAKRQHYVPRSYLRGFTEDGEHLFVFDKSTKTSFRTSVGNVAAERYFYDSSESQGMEEKLARLDGIYPEWRDGIVGTVTSGNDIAFEHRAKLAFFMAIQLRRTRWFRDTIISGAKLIEEGFDSISDGFKKRFGVSLKPDFVLSQFLAPDKERAGKAAQARSLRSFPRLYELMEILTDHIWIVGVNQTTQPFYTSNNPLVIWPHKRHPTRAFVGLQSEGIEIAFPLDSWHILTLLERTYHVKLEPLDCQSIPIGDDGVVNYNGLQVAESHRWLYCRSDTFGLVDQLCNQPQKQPTA